MTENNFWAYAYLIFWVLGMLFAFSPLYDVDSIIKRLKTMKTKTKKTTNALVSSLISSIRDSVQPSVINLKGKSPTSLQCHQLPPQCPLLFNPPSPCPMDSAITPLTDCPHFEKLEFTPVTPSDYIGGGSLNWDELLKPNPQPLIMYGSAESFKALDDAIKEYAEIEEKFVLTGEIPDDLELNLNTKKMVTFTPTSKTISSLIYLYSLLSSLYSNVVQRLYINPKVKPSITTEEELFNLEQQLDIPSHLRYYTNSTSKAMVPDISRESYDKRTFPTLYAQEDFTEGYCLYIKDDEISPYNVNYDTVVDMMRFNLVNSQRKIFMDNAPML